LEGFARVEPGARRREVVGEAGQAGLVLEQPDRVHLGASQGIESPPDLRDDARTARPVRQEVGESVDVTVRRGRRGEQEPGEVDGGKAAQAASPGSGGRYEAARTVQGDPGDAIDPFET